MCGRPMMMNDDALMLNPAPMNGSECVDEGQEVQTVCTDKAADGVPPQAQHAAPQQPWRGVRELRQDTHAATGRAHAGPQEKSVAPVRAATRRGAQARSGAA